MTELPTPGTKLRCVDARVRKVAPGALISDFEKRQAGIIEVMEIVTVREAESFAPYGGVPAVRLVEVERRLEGIRRHRATKVYIMDRPFLLDRFVVIRGGSDDEAPEPAPQERELA